MLGTLLWNVFLLPLYAQAPDTSKTYSLGEVVVNERYNTPEVRSSAPVQILNSKDLHSLNALQLSDAVKHFSGVTVKDYGGIGGMKTVSLRSLGANHTAVGYDGIAITDCQTGQIDISRFSIENVDAITLYNGQSDNIFQPARLFASAGVLNIRTVTPLFEPGKTWNAKVALKAGSFGFVNPFLLIEKKISSRWALSLNTEWMSSNGEYPYTLYYGGKGDSTSREKRNNSDVKTFRVEGGAYGRFSPSDSWRIKAYYYQSSRGLPGATIYYNPYATQHLWDRNFFAQSNYKKEFSPLFAFQVAGKYNWSYQRYLDPDALSENAKDNNYRQQEYYLTASLLYRVLPDFSLSLSTDGAINTFSADHYNFSFPTRYTWLTALAAKYANEWLTASGSILATLINEDTKVGKCAGNHRKLSPYLSLSFKPIRNEELRIRAFYKHIFRLPSFNDLYYPRVGNPDLKPENAIQYNIGITYAKSIAAWLPRIKATIDGYYNRITDKIVAKPSKNIFNWSMYNIGVVAIKGADVTGEMIFKLTDKITLGLSGNFTYQQALDITENSETYKQQIAYTPRVSGSGNAVLEMPWINFNYSFLASGSRYTLDQNIMENYLPGYRDHSLSANRSFRFGQYTTKINLEILNILNKNYEIVKNFPMPGRSFRITLSVNY
ncbi:MAG: TonB-dependent receptor [Bacteroidales bacterium]|nr:TonB-dependent receptor [Bacteroidales bacterium]